MHSAIQPGPHDAPSPVPPALSQLDADGKPLPDSLSRLDELPALAADAREVLLRIQARSHAGMLRVAERFALAHGAHAVALADETLAPLEATMAARMPPGYRFLIPVDWLAQAAAGRCAWARHSLALALALQAQAHYRASIAPDGQLSAGWRALFLGNWRRVAPRAAQAAQACVREMVVLDAARQATAVDDLLALLATLDGAVQVQAEADAACFLDHPQARDVTAEAVRALLLRAYRWQFVAIGLQEARFVVLLQSLLDAGQLRRLRSALAPLLAAVR